MGKKELGVAVVGAGRIGSLRARLAAAHPSVRFVAISDLDAARAAAVAKQVGAEFASGDNFGVIDRPEVDAVIVATSEPEHAVPVLHALECGKPVLVEKPIALTLEDADRMVAAAYRTGVELRVGYTMRFQRRYLVAKEQIVQGRLGRIVGGTGRLYNTRAHGLQILQRSAKATFVQDALTYLVDAFGWYLEGRRPIEVFARGHGVVYREAG